MTITTKYGIDDVLRFMQDNKPMAAKVLWLECKRGKLASNQYILKGDKKVDSEWLIYKWEKELFRSKEELIQSL